MSSVITPILTCSTRARAGVVSGVGKEPVKQLVERERPRLPTGKLRDESHVTAAESKPWFVKLQVWNGDRLQRADRALVTQFANLQGSLSQVLFPVAVS